MSVNKVMLTGNTTKNIEITNLQSGKKVGKFGIAVKRKYGDNVVDFINIVVWDKLADNVEKFCPKGSKIAVIGELQTRSYESNGEKRFTYEVLASEVEFLSTPKEELKPVDDDNCPF